MTWLRCSLVADGVAFEMLIPCNAAAIACATVDSMFEGISAIDSNFAFNNPIVVSNASILWLCVVTLALVDNELDPKLLLTGEAGANG